MSQRRTIDDESVLRELRAYEAALEAGGAPGRAELLARFPEITDDLTACLDSLDLVHRIAPQFGDGGAQDFEPTAPLGDFQILREVGRGGMGVVYEAEQISLGRRVALKVLPFAAVLDSRYLQRFKNEAQAAAHLHHTNIVPVHAVGCQRGVHYYAMQFIDGPTVADLIDELKGFATNGKGEASSAALEAIVKGRTTESPAFCRAVARLGIQAAEALDHAHESGVVHRDIKPPNLIVDASGHLWITDFGLASTRNDSGLTVTGDIVGTVRYMSPEQALAKRVPIDHRTDIYSLGVTLYELLTLTHAFPGDDVGTVMQKISFKEPVRPRALNPATAPELETILLKAMSKAPEDRYDTAQEMADDLHRFLEDRPIHARRPTLPKRVAQWARRHQPVVWAAAVVLVLALAGLASGMVMVAREKNRAEGSAKRAKDNYTRSLRLIDQVVRRLGDAMAFDPNLSTAQRSILRDALGFFQESFDDAPEDRHARRELALAYEGAGWVNHLLRQHADAERNFAQALVEFEALHAEASDPAAYLEDLASLHERRGQLFIDMEGRAEDARRSLAEGLRCAATLRTLRPTEPAPRHRQARLHRALGLFFERAEHDLEAVRAFEHARDLLDALSAEHPDPAYRADLSECWYRLMRFWLRKKERERWRDACLKADEIAAELEARNPEDTRIRSLRDAIHANTVNAWVQEGWHREFAESPPREAEFETNPDLELGPSPTAYRARASTATVRSVGVDGLPDGGFLVHKTRGQSNVLGEFTGEAWVYRRQCWPGYKALTRAVWRTANGDELHANIENTRGGTGTFLIVGGTGRFENARGHGTQEAVSHPEYGAVVIQRGTIWRVR